MGTFVLGGLAGLPAGHPEIILGAETANAVVGFVCPGLFHLSDFDVSNLMPGIDQAAMDEEAGFRPTPGQRLDFAFHILLVFDGDEVEGFAAVQERAQLSDERLLI